MHMRRGQSTFAPVRKSAPKWFAKHNYAGPRQGHAEPLRYSKNKFHQTAYRFLLFMYKPFWGAGGSLKEGQYVALYDT